MNKVTRSQAIVGPQRENFLHSRLGRLFLMFENAVYNTAGAFTPYSGGLWSFYELSNGGFFMAPSAENTWHFQNAGNYSDVQLSSEALGIVSCLYAFSHISFDYPEIGRYYHLLTEYLEDHPEASEIFQAID